MDRLEVWDRYFQIGLANVALRAGCIGPSRVGFDNAKEHVAHAAAFADEAYKAWLQREQVGLPARDKEEGK